MSLEAGDGFISGLVITNPVGATDPKSQGDDHIRLIKTALKGTFPNLTGAVTASQAELNILDGVTASAAELNILDGATLSTAELNILDGVTLTAVQINDAARKSVANTFTALVTMNAGAEGLRLKASDTTGDAYIRFVDSADATKGFMGFTASGDDTFSMTSNEDHMLKFRTGDGVGGFIDRVYMYGSGANESYLSIVSPRTDDTGGAYIRFLENDGSTTKGFVGYASTTHNHISIINSESSGNVELTPGSGGGLTLTGAVTTPNTTASEVGYKGVPINTQNGNYTLVIGDAGKTIEKASGAGNTITIPANGSVAFPIGTAIVIANHSGSDVSIAITTDTLVLAAAGTTGTRTLSGNWGVATITKLLSTSWVITGTGLS